MSQIHDEAGRAAVLMARAAALNAKIAGMIAENQFRVSNGESIAFGEDEFRAVLNVSGCHHNGIVALMLHGSLE